MDFMTIGNDLIFIYLVRILNRAGDDRLTAAALIWAAARRMLSRGPRLLAGRSVPLDHDTGMWRPDARVVTARHWPGQSANDAVERRRCACVQRLGRPSGDGRAILARATLRHGGAW